jgi:prepilin-type N-terminal cleavage/methylation domain-containing protein
VYKRGLTLIEIIVSVVLISLTLIALANLFLGGKRYIIYSRSKMSAGEVSKYFLDPLRMDVRQDVWGSNCLSANVSCPGPQNITYGSYNITYTPAYNFTANVSGTTLSKVRLNITWTEPPP